MKKGFIHVLGGMLILAAGASATTISFDGVPTIGSQRTNWSDVISFQQFDPALGTLTGVSIALKGDIDGDVRVESLDAAPTTITSSLAATITLSFLGNNIVVVIPTVNKVDDVSAFDGSIDFGGTSGRTYTNVTGSATKSGAVANALWANFIGLGTVSTDVAAVAASTATGAGNLITQFGTFAGANAVVTYTYTPNTVIPEPSSLATAGVAVVALAVGAWRRKRA